MQCLPLNERHCNQQLALGGEFLTELLTCAWCVKVRNHPNHEVLDSSLKGFRESRNRNCFFFKQFFSLQDLCLGDAFCKLGLGFLGRLFCLGTQICGSKYWVVLK